MARTILHCDLNNFYASVECLLRPELALVPMAVGGNEDNRHGIILAKNELAKAYGIQTAETIWQAKRKCPQLVIVPPQHEEYEKYSNLVRSLYEEFTDRVEPFGIDESWLDVSTVAGLYGNGEEIAHKIRCLVKERFGLTISVGVSFNKIFAKLGSDYKKPDAVTVINEENFRKLVFPLPVTDLLYVGSATGQVLARMQIRTIGDLAKSHKPLLKSRLGKVGELLYEYANGLDDSPVKESQEGRELKSVGNGMTFKRNLVGLGDIKVGVSFLSDEVAVRLRAYDLKCRAVQVMIKDTSFKSISRQKTLAYPTYLYKEIEQAALELITASWRLQQPIRTLTITGLQLVPSQNSTRQLQLFAPENTEQKERQEKIETAVANIRARYGKESIAPGLILGNDLGIEDFKKPKPKPKTLPPPQD